MKLHAPAAERNRGPILEVLRRLLAVGDVGDAADASLTVLEVASGTGTHAVHFAAGLPHVQWQPSDPSPDALASIAAWAAEASLPNLRPPVPLDTTSATWPVENADAIFCANMIHIAPWEACLGLLAGAGRVLTSQGRLMLYGPFQFGGRYTAPSNARFDQSLRSRDPRWGVRDLDIVTAEAALVGLEHAETIEMPANNFVVVFRRSPTVD